MDNCQNKQPELFDMAVYDAMPKFDCSNCYCGYWHNYDLDRIKIGRIPTCERCNKCTLFDIEGAKKLVIKWNDEFYKFFDKLYATKRKDRWVKDGSFVFDDDVETSNSSEGVEITNSVEVEQDIFNLQEEVEINNKYQEELFQQANKELHKNAVLPYFYNPQNDNEMLFNYQYEYLKNDDMNAWQKLLELSTEVMQRMLWKWLKTHKEDFLDSVAQSEKVSEAVFYVLRRYKTQLGWYCEKNFIGCLKSGLLHAMRYQTKIDKNTLVTGDIGEYVRKN